MRRQDRTVLVAAFERPAAKSVGRGDALLEQVLRAASTRRTLQARVAAGYLPLTLGLLRRAIDGALDRGPDAVILLAEAGAGDEFLLERIALNRSPADSGRPGARLISTGPDAYLASVTIGPALGMLQRAGIPCRSSSDPRPTAANAGYYLALHRLHGTGKDPTPPVLLLRIPGRSPHLPLRRSARAVLLLVDHLATRRAPANGATPTRRAAPRATVRPKGGPQSL